MVKASLKEFEWKDQDEQVSDMLFCPPSSPEDQEGLIPSLFSNLLLTSASSKKVCSKFLAVSAPTQIRDDSSDATVSGLARRNLNDPFNTMDDESLLKDYVEYCRRRDGLSLLVERLQMSIDANDAQIESMSP